MSDNLLQYSTWPSSLELATSCKLIRTSSTGNIRLLSSDGGAWAELACHGQTLTTYHLVKLPRDGGGRGGEREGVGEAVAGLSVGVQVREGGGDSEKRGRERWREGVGERGRGRNF